jgi:putative addiction module CopG family antidote
MIERKALNVSVTSELHTFVDELVKSGSYRDHSEVVEAALRLLQHMEVQRQMAAAGSKKTGPGS